MRLAGLPGMDRPVSDGSSARRTWVTGALCCRRTHSLRVGQEIGRPPRICGADRRSQTRSRSPEEAWQVVRATLQADPKVVSEDVHIGLVAHVTPSASRGDRLTTPASALSHSPRPELPLVRTR